MRLTPIKHIFWSNDSSTRVYWFLGVSLLLHTCIAQTITRIQVQATYFENPKQFGYFVALYGLVWACYALLCCSAQRLPLFHVLVCALVLRVVWLFDLPNLSDDYFRFVWDGRLLAHHINPYLVLPHTFVHTHTASVLHLEEVFKGLNSPRYYTVYPPVNQLFFGLASFFGKSTEHTLTWMRLFLLVADLGLIALLYRLLNRFKQNPSRVVLYAFNPLVVMELVGNLHFEGLMMFFVVLSVYWLASSHKMLEAAAAAWGLAVATKLLPLLFLPLLFVRLQWKRGTLFSVLTLLVFGATFLPFQPLPTVAHNMQTSLNLYYGTFEFNASLFYLIRYMGFEWFGYDVVQQAMPYLAKIVLGFVLAWAWLHKNATWQGFFCSAVVAHGVYLLCSAIVHPWYLVPSLVLGVFVSYRFVWVWSASIVLSYSAYQYPDYHENNFLIGLEYGLVLLALFVDIRQKKASFVQRSFLDLGHVQSKSYFISN